MFTIDQLGIGLIVATVEELLKNPFIKVEVEKYPRLSQWALSLVATVIYSYKNGNLTLSDWKQFCLDLFSVVATSYVVYKTIIKK